MKTNLLLLFCSLILIFMLSCKDDKAVSSDDETESEYTPENKGASDFEEAIIPDTVNSIITKNTELASASLKEEKNAPVATKSLFLAKVSPASTYAGLGLPSSFTQRTFLYNPLGRTSEDAISKLVGKIVKKKTINKIECYEETGQSYRLATSNIKATTPISNLLVEKTYTANTGMNIKYLISEAKVSSNTAYEVIVNDIAEASIEETDIDKKRLFDTYGNDATKNEYFIVLVATSTKIYYKEFETVERNADFNYLIKINGNSYKKKTDIMQDWKVGMKITPITEILKGFK